jgi:hypothetical protein
MYRIDVATAVAVKPGYPAGGVGGFFANCNPGEGFPGTTLDAYFLNRVQEEICNVIVGAGIALNPATDNQLFLAIQNLILGAVPLLPDYGKRPVVSSATHHTVDVDDDLNAVIDFTAGGTNCVLPASTPNLGFPLTIVNSAAAGQVSLVPNGSDTVDGFPDRKLGPGDRVDIIAIGGAWRSIGGWYSETSGEQVVTLGVGGIVSHGLRKRPEIVKSWLRCKSAELGYAVNDEVDLSVATAGGVGGMSVMSDASILRYSIGNPYGISINPRDGGAYQYVTPSNWRLLLKSFVR